MFCVSCIAHTVDIAGTIKSHILLLDFFCYPEQHISETGSVAYLGEENGKHWYSKGRYLEESLDPLKKEMVRGGLKQTMS
jgi:hypothetical protein